MSATSTLRLAILGLIASEPRSGYDLRKVFATAAMGHFSASPGAIYPALQQLEKAGLITGTVETGRTSRPRQPYTLTAAGLAALKRALSEPVTRDDLIWRLDRLFLRFAFMGEALGRRAAVSFLEELSAQLTTYVRSLEKDLEALPRDPVPTGRLALEHGVESYRATLRWARRAARELAATGQRKTREVG